MRKKKVNYANRGKPFESNINRSNIAYRAKGWAVIEKSHPPIKIQQHSGNKVIGFKQGRGFVDYFGVYNGRALAFEAKSVKNRTSFALNNIKAHQVESLRHWQDQGGISFLLVEFEKHKETFFVKYSDFSEWWEAALKGGRKSIPYDWFVMNCDLVKTSRGVPLDYLKCV